MAQERRVLLANGQYITIVQTTGTSSGDVMSQSAVTAALNAKSDVGHTHNASAITGGTFGTARIADGAVTLAKLGNDVPISTTSYETVTVSGITSSGTAAVGAEVTIGGASYKFDSTGVISVLIPYGQIYKIQAYPNSTWIVNYEATFTANTPLRTISIVYVEPNGVFIEAKDGMLYTSSNWDSGKTPNSIVVLTDNVKFRMALAEQLNMAINNSHTCTLENYMTPISNETTAKADYDGAGNTAKILQMQPSTNYAAGYCNAFVFPDGKTKGFLPSLGQLYFVRQNITTINEALSKCGGLAMSSDYFWSSTFWGIDTDFNGRCCWLIKWGDFSVIKNYISNSRGIRPFGAYTL